MTEDPSRSSEPEVGVYEPDDRERTRRKNLKKLQEEYEVLPLDPWERYRALTDFGREQMDVVEMADRKTRFALVILAVLNALNLVAVARPEVVTGTDVQLGAGIALYVAAYALLSLYLCLQAIGALKPRLAGVLSETSRQSKFQRWLDLLSLDTMPNRPADEYYELWRTAQFGQLNREMAFRNQTMAGVILEKYAALDRLYRGLSILVALTGALILFLVMTRFSAWIGLA